MNELIVLIERNSLFIMISIPIIIYVLLFTIDILTQRIAENFAKAFAKAAIEVVDRYYEHKRKENK